MAFTKAPAVETTAHTWPAKILWGTYREGFHDPLHIAGFERHGSQAEKLVLVLILSWYFSTGISVLSGVPCL